MAPPKLHLDADTSIRALHKALLARGHDVTRTPADWIALDAGDEEQLLASTAQGRCLFTFNVRDLTVPARRYPHHGGVVLAAQAGWSLSDLIAALRSAVVRDGGRRVDRPGALAERLASRQGIAVMPGWAGGTGDVDEMLKG